MFSEDFLYFISALQNAETIPEVLECWNMISYEYPDTKIIIGVKDSTHLSKHQWLNNISFDFDNKPYLKSYFPTDSLYFLNSNKEKLLAKNNRKVKIKYPFLIFLDTNMTIYIKNYFIRKDLVQDYIEDSTWITIVELIESLLYYRFDCNNNFYILENTRFILPKYELYKNIDCSPLEFWGELEQVIRDNLTSLILFNSINSAYRLTKEEAEEKAIEEVYKIYFSQNSVISEFIPLHNTIYLLLIKIFQIHFAANKSPENKLLELLDYMHNNLGFVMERESIIASELFKGINKFKIFKDIKQKPQEKHWKKENLGSKIKNIAWDLMIPRFIETCLANLPNNELFIPYFLTFDRGLNQILDLYPVRGIVYEAKFGQITPIPDADLCSILQPEERYKYFSVSAIQERTTGRIDVNSFDFAKLIEKELEQLLAILNV